MNKIYTLLLLLGLTCSISAGEFGLTEFRGEHKEESPLLISPDKSPDCDNMDVSGDGLSVYRRGGQDWKFEITYPTWTVKSFGDVKNNTYDKLLVGYGPHIESFNVAWNASTMLHSSATANYVWDFARFRDGNTYATNGKDTVFYTNGLTKTFITSAPKGTSIVFYNDTCFISNTGNNKARIQYAAWSDATDWTTGTGPTEGRVVDVADYGEKIVDLEVLGDGILILCTKSIMKMIGTQNPYQVIEIDKSVGCKSKGSVSTHLGWTFFLGDDGQKYKTNGNIIEGISEDEYLSVFEATALSQRTSNFSSLTTESDWETGITSHTSTEEISGSVALPTGTTTWTTDSDWESFTIVNGTVSKDALEFKNEGDWSAVSSVIDTELTSGYNLFWGLIDGTTVDFLFTGSTYYYYVRTSTDSLMGDDPTWVNQVSDGQIITGVLNKRYIQFKTSGTIVLAEQEQVEYGYGYIYDVTLNWGTTGYYITPEITTTDLNTWGLFEAVDVQSDPTASITYFTYSSNTVVSNDNLKDVVSWTAQTNNTIIAVSTNTYVWAKAVYDIDFTSETPRTEAITLSWTSGDSVTEDMTAQWHEERLYLGVMKEINSSSNDGVFVYDPDLEAWWSYKTGIYPGVFFKWKNTFLVASSTSGVVYEFLEGDDDNGADIACYYKSKYFTGTEGLSPFITSLDYYTVIYSTQNTGNMLIDTYLNGSSTASNIYTIDQTLNSTQDIDFKSYKFPQENNCRYFQFKVYNESGSDIDLLGIVGSSTNFPFKLQTQ